MSAPSLYDSLQIAFNFMEQAEKLAESKEYEAALAALDKAKAYAFNNEALLEDIQQRFDALRNARRHYIKQLEEEAANLFNREPFDAPKAREVLQALLQQDGQSELAQSLWAELPARETAERERQLVVEFEQELQAIWQQAGQLEAAGNGSGALAEFERALIEATKKAADAPNVIPLQRLKLTAAEKRNHARDKWEGIPALIRARKGAELVEYFQALKRNGEVETEFFDENGRFAGRFAIDECIEQAQQLAGHFAQEQVQTYINEAHDLLAESPGAAYQKIQEAFEIANLSSAAKALLEQELREKIQPAIEKREKALAQLQTALSREVPLEAWQALAEIETLDRFTPGLDNARQSLAVTLENNLTRLLETGQQFQELEDFETAQARFQDAIKIGRIIAPYNKTLAQLHRKAEATLELCVQAQKEAAQYEQRLAEISELSQTAPEEARARLTQLAAEELSAQMTAKIERLKTQIELKLGVNQQFHTLEQKMLTAADPVELIPIEEGAKQAGQDHPTDERFARLVERIAARRAYLKGVTLCEDPEQYVEASKLLRQVVERQGDDAAAAQTLLEKISISEQQETDIAITIEEATQAIDKGDFRSAFLLLQAHRYAASRQAARIRELISTATIHWRANVEQQLAELVEKGDFILPQIEFLLHELERSQAPSVDEWRLKALAPAYATTAKDLQELNRWDEAELLWEEAFRLSPKDPAIVEGRRTAHKHRALLQAQSTIDPAERGKILEDLHRAYGDDPMIKRYLAAFYYSQNRYAEARMALTQMRFLLERLDPSVAGSELETIRHMEQRIQESENIDKQKTAIRSQISENAPLDQLREARLAYAKLLATLDQADKLERWWQAVIEEPVKQLKSEVAKLSDKAGTVWERTKMLCKILILQGDAQTREQAQRLLKLAYDQLPPELELVVENPEGIGYGSADEALANHIARAKALHKHIKEMSQIQHIVTDLGVDAGQSALNDALYKLELALEKLYYSQEKRREIVDYKNAGLTTGKWGSIEDTLQELKLKGWSEHRGLRDLSEEVAEAKQRRANLESLVEQINEAVAQEQFNTAQEHLAAMLARDPDDETQLQANLEVVDPYTNQKIVGRDEIEQLIAAKLVLADEVRQWQAQSQPVINWLIVRSRITKLTEQGEFKPAVELARAALGQNNQHPIFKDRAWSLEHYRQYLETFPVTPEQLNSRFAQTTFDETMQKAQLLMSQINECETIIEDLHQKEKEFRQILSNLKPLLQRLNERKFLSSIFASSAEAREIKQQVLDLVKRGREICPAHPGLANFEETEFLNK